MNVGHVEGGTHAGWKRQKPAPKPWTCGCAAHHRIIARREQPAYMGRCTDCGTKRP